MGQCKGDAECARWMCLFIHDDFESNRSATDLAFFGHPLRILDRRGVGCSSVMGLHHSFLYRGACLGFGPRLAMAPSAIAAESWWAYLLGWRGGRTSPKSCHPGL